MQAQVFDPSVKLSSPQIQVERSATIHTPPPKLRDHFFDEAGVSTYIGGLRHLDRDRLYDRSGIYPLERLTKFYPDIPEINLERLRKIVLEREISQSQAKSP
jgi:hypothetical protein